MHILHAWRRLEWVRMGEILAPMLGDMPRSSISFTYSNVRLPPHVASLHSSDIPMRPAVRFGGDLQSTVLLDSMVASVVGVPSLSVPKWHVIGPAERCRPLPVTAMIVPPSIGPTGGDEPMSCTSTYSKCSSEEMS